MRGINRRKTSAVGRTSAGLNFPFLLRSDQPITLTLYFENEFVQTLLGNLFVVCAERNFRHLFIPIQPVATTIQTIKNPLP